MYRIISRSARGIRFAWKNKGRLAPYMGAFLWLLLLVGMTLWNRGNAAQLSECYHGVSLRYTAPAVSISDISRAIENEENAGREEPRITAWSHEESGKIAGTLHPAEADVQIYRIYGEAAEVYPFSGLKGSCPDKNDAEGCMVSSAVSEKLYGNRDCLGKRIVYNGVKYTVRGIFTDDKPTFLYTDSSSKAIYTNLEISFGEYEDAAMELFLSRSGFPAAAMKYYGGLHAEIISYYLMLPLWAAVLSLYIMILRLNLRDFRHSCGKLRKSIDCAIISLLFIGILYLMGFRLYLPDRLIPNKWSDFTFYTDKFSELSGYIERMVYSIQDVKDYVLLQKTFVSFVLTVSSSIISIAFMSRMRCRQLLSALCEGR